MSEEDISSKVKFSDVCTLLEKVQRANKPKRKVEPLRGYIESFDAFKRQFKTSTGQNDVSKSSFYAVLRLLVPNADHGRRSYGIQIKTMGLLYIKLLNLAPESDDAHKLKYKNDVAGCADFAEVVYTVMKSRCKENASSTTVADVNNLLEIAACNDRRATELELTKFIENASPLEQKWLIRIILKKLHLGLGEQKILNVYHPRAKEFFERNSDLLAVCEYVESGDQPILNEAVTIFKHIRPMLCELLNLKKIEKIFQSDVFYVETKMDGERFHIHMQNGTFKYFSRNGVDYTKTFGGTASEGNLSPLIAKLIDSVASSLILDGEMMVWDKEEACYRVKGENIDVKYLNLGENVRPCFVVYDVLYMNGTSYLGKTYSQRNVILQQIIKEQAGILAICKRSKVDSLKHLTECINEAIDDDEEGVVIKGEKSLYKPGARNGGWYKIKPDYINGVISEFDLVVIGGFYKRNNKFVSKFMFGVYKKENQNEDSPCFCSFAKVGLGLSYEKRKYLNQLLAPHWKSINDRGESSTKCIEWGTLLPHVWINPKNSVVVQVRATELVLSSSYKTSHTLRFPRMEHIRLDKSWNESCTLEEVEAFCKDADGVAKVTKRAVREDDFAPVPKRAKRTTNSNSSSVYSTIIDENQIDKVSNALNGTSFCILSTSRGKPSIPELKQIVIKNGGKVVENPLADINKCSCVAGEVTFRVKKLIEKGTHDIASIDWLIRAFGSEEASKSDRMIKPSDMIFTTATMQDEFKKRFDEYGDSFVDHVKTKDVNDLFASMDVQKLPRLLQSEIYDIEEKIYGAGNMYNIFRATYAQFYYPNNKLPKMMKLSKLVFQGRGGKIVDSKESKYYKKVQFIIVDAYCTQKEELDKWITEHFKRHTENVKVISYRWILECDDKNEKLEIGPYVLVNQLGGANLS